MRIVLYGQTSNLKSCKFANTMFSMKTRMSEEFIKFIEDNTEQLQTYKDGSETRKLNEKYGSTVYIIDVDTSRPWTIMEYDADEYIQYLDYEVVDENVNYCKLP